MTETAGVPEGDQFAVVAEHSPTDLVYDDGYLGIERTDSVVFVQITFNDGRSLVQERALYARIVELVGETSGRPSRGRPHQSGRDGRGEPVFGNGEMSYDPEVEASVE